VLSGIKVVIVCSRDTFTCQLICDRSTSSDDLDQCYLNGILVTRQIQCVLPVHTKVLGPIELQPSCRNTIIRVNAGATVSRQFSLHHLEKLRKKRLLVVRAERATPRPPCNQFKARALQVHLGTSPRDFTFISNSTQPTPAMPKALTFKGDKPKPKKRKRTQEQKDESSNQLAPSADLAAEAEHDENWVSVDAVSDLAGPVMLVFPSEPVMALACDQLGTVFASKVENMVEGVASSAEPHDVRQVFVATRVVGSETDVVLKGCNGRYVLNKKNNYRYSLQERPCSLTVVPPQVSRLRQHRHPLNNPRSHLPRRNLQSPPLFHPARPLHPALHARHLPQHLHHLHPSLNPGRRRRDIPRNGSPPADASAVQAEE